MRDKAKQKEYMKNYMRQKRAKAKADPNEQFHYHGKDEINDREEERNREIKARDEEKRLKESKERNPKHEKDFPKTSIWSENWGSEIQTDAQTPQFENEKLTDKPECLGANAWSQNSTTPDGKPQIRKQSNQDVLRDQFGDNSE